MKKTIELLKAIHAALDIPYPQPLDKADRWLWRAFVVFIAALLVL